MFDIAALDPKLWIELKRIVPMKECVRLSGMSEDTIEKYFPDKIVKLSDRCRGMRVADALMLDAPVKDTA